MGGRGGKAGGGGGGGGAATEVDRVRSAVAAQRQAEEDVRKAGAGVREAQRAGTPEDVTKANRRRNAAEQKAAFLAGKTREANAAAKTKAAATRQVQQVTRAKAELAVLKKTSAKGLRDEISRNHRVFDSRGMTKGDLVNQLMHDKFRPGVVTEAFKK